MIPNAHNPIPTFIKEGFSKDDNADWPFDINEVFLQIEDILGKEAYYRISYQLHRFYEAVFDVPYEEHYKDIFLPLANGIRVHPCCKMINDYFTSSLMITLPYD